MTYMEECELGMPCPRPLACALKLCLQPYAWDAYRSRKPDEVWNFIHPSIQPSMVRLVRRRTELLASRDLNATGRRRSRFKVGLVGKERYTGAGREAQRKIWWTKRERLGQGERPRGRSDRWTDEVSVRSKSLYLVSVLLWLIPRGPSRTWCEAKWGRSGPPSGSRHSPWHRESETHSVSGFLVSWSSRD